MKRLSLAVVLSLAGLSRAHAAAYFQQASLPPAFPVTAGIDRDSLGNVYVLGQPTGSATYWVAAFRAPEMTPLFSFDTGVSTPAAFAVEGSGIVDVADLGVSTTAMILRRFQNTGAFMGQAEISLSMGPYYPPKTVMSATIDKSNRLVHITSQHHVTYYCLMCLGCGCPPSGTKGFIDTFDFSGTLVRTTTMPGISATYGSCYTPSKVSADPQGNMFVADNTCQHVLKYSPTGALLNDWAASKWSNYYQFTSRAMWSDPDSNLYIGQPVCGPSGCQPGVVKLDGSGNSLAQFAGDSSAACAWDDRMLYLAGPATASQRRMVYNSAPAVPAEIAPIGPVVQHSSSTVLAWQYASDPEGDPVVYSVFLGSSPLALTPIGTTPTQSLETASLVFETTYYWQVTAQDQYEGVPLQTQQAPVVSFRLSLQNSAPSAFAVAGGTGTVVTRDTSVRLSWQRPSDADGDPLVYDLTWRAPGQAAVTVSSIPETSRLMSGLAFGGTYYWSVRARDVYGASSSMAGGQEQPYYPVFRNGAPSMPVSLNVASVYSLHTASPAVTLSWYPSEDPDGDPVTYRAELASGVETWSVALGSATAFTLPLAYETTYYWRAIALDSYGGASTGPWQSLVAHLANREPAALVYTAPSSLVTRSTSVALSWQDTGDPDGDPYAYALSISTDPGTLTQVQSGLRTSYSLGFQYGTTYYWQVAATDSFGARAEGPVQSFLALFKNAVPGMPTIFSGAGTSFQHTLTPAAVLDWSAVGDPDGDLTAYRLWVGGSPQSMAVAQDGPETFYSLPSPQLGATYYWQVSAYDPYGGAATTPVQALLIQLQNAAPTAPGALTGSGLLSTRGTSQVLSWSAAYDSDGDAVAYEFALSTNAAALPVVRVSSATSYTLSFQYGTTYYWQAAARDGFGGVSATGVQTLLPVFRNSAPTVPSNLSKTGTLSYHGWSPSQSLFWQDAADPDGDAFTYSVYFGTDSERPSPIGSAPLGYTVSNLAVNTAYYYRIVATDIYGAASASPLNWVYYQFYNTAPRAFDPVGPTGSLITRDANQSLSWTASGDPDGDLVTYRVYVGTSSGSLAALTDTTQTAAPWTGLPFGATYYWRVDAFDAFGATTAASGGVQSFGLTFRNSPPSAPGYVSTAAVHEFHTTFPSIDLSWSASPDADGDPVSYRLDLGLSTGSAQAFSLGASTSFNLKPLFETTYYWRVTAADPYGGATTGPWTSALARFVNRAPAVPAVLGGAGVSRQHTLTPSVSLSWSTSADPDGDPTAYRLAVGSAPQGLSVIQDGPLTSYAIPAPQLGTTYYWQVSAYDPYGGLASTPVQALLVELQYEAPAAPAPLTGTGPLSTRNTSQILSWSKAADPDGDAVTYEFSLSTDPTALPVVQASTATSYALAFQYGTNYYWQAAARDSFGAVSATGVQVFQPSFRNSAPTVPANLSKSGTIPYHGWSPSQSIFWQDSADPDGDSFTYSVQFGTNSERLSPVTPASLGHTFQNLAVNTAYYYRIVATDIYGAASASPLNWVFYQFSNGAPQAFDPIGPAGTLVTRNANQSLSWTSSSDPDADLVTYRVYVGTSAGALAALADTTQTSAPWPGLAFGSTYYWRVDAYDAFGATTAASGGIRSFALVFRNSAPGALLYTSTAAVREFHTLSPELSLSWAPAGDADGDTVAYRLDLGLSTGSWQSTDLAEATAFALKPLFDTTYYWRVTAVDSYGASTTGPWSSIVARFVNRAPAVPSILSGAGESRQHTLTPNVVFSWSAAADPEGDPVVFRLQVGTAPSALAPVQEGAQTSYLLPAPQFGTTYYWQVTALDHFGATAATPMQSLGLSLDNTAPAPFSPLTGTGALSTRETTQLLSWEPSQDADLDPLAYGLFLSSGAAAPALVQFSTTTSFPLAFQFGTTYYWRVDAFDGFGGTTTANGGVQTFLPTFLNDPPAPLNVTSPFKGSPVVSTMHNQVSLAWERVTTPQGDPITYTVYLGESPDSLQVLTRISQEQVPAGLMVSARPSQLRPQTEVSADGNTVKLTITSLDYYRRYYLRITASNPYGSTSQTPLQAFSLSAANGFPKAYNYPNPFSPGRGGTRIVFNAPPSGYTRAVVSVYSELQDLLFRREYANILPGISEIVFEGRDRYGRAFFNGSYICHVRFEGPDDKETFYLMVVK
ncbi:MAG: hypothetical protein HY403_06085 [Elusimicrobia bacterium]|nr:hypothetical protein [Elusimicrobiota bacterium]